MNPVVEPTRVGLDNSAFSGRLRQPVQDVKPPPVTLTPPVEGGSPAVAWTTPPPQPAPVVTVPTEPPPAAGLEPPKPVWAQPPPADPPAETVAEPEAVQAPEPSPLPQPQPAPPAMPEPPITPPAPEPTPGPLPQPEPPVIQPQPFVNPAEPRPQPSRVLRRSLKPLETQPFAAKLDPRRYSKPQAVLAAVAAIVFLAGLNMSLQTIKSNHQAAAQVAALNGQADKQFQSSLQNLGKTAGDQTAGKPDAKAFSQYAVSADLARYLEVPKLGLVARVAQTGITAKGALGTPDNAYDAAWYAASVSPGKPGVVLIDGLGYNQGKPAVFSDLAQLSAGDAVQIVKGDNTVINYRVVSVQAFQADQLTLQAALTAATAGKPGLNLLSMPDTAHGGTQSVLVQAEQI